MSQKTLPLVYAVLSRVVKNDLLALLRDVAFPNLPIDWRTLEKRRKAELSLTNEYSQKSMVHDYVVTVCGNCFLFRYDQEALKLVTPCSHCNVSTIHCGMLNSTYPCVVTESLGQIDEHTWKLPLHVLGWLRFQTHRSGIWIPLSHIRSSHVCWQTRCFEFTCPFKKPFFIWTRFLHFHNISFVVHGMGGEHPGFSL